MNGVKPPLQLACSVCCLLGIAGSARLRVQRFVTDVAARRIARVRPFPLFATEIVNRIGVRIGRRRAGLSPQRGNEARVHRVQLMVIFLDRRR